MKHIFKCLALLLGIPSGSAEKSTPAVQELPRDVVQSLGWEDPLEEVMATHSSVLAWRIRLTEEPGGLQSMELQSRTQLITQTHTHRFQENTYSGNGLSGHLVETMGSPGSLYLASRSYTHWGNLLVI